MQTYIALLRGINVGGKNTLPMKTLISIFEKCGSAKVRTYIQSGNVVFMHNERSTVKLAESIRKEIKTRCGFEPAVLILEKKELEKAMAENPFPEAEDASKTLHVGFLCSKLTSPDFKSLDRLKNQTERYHLADSVFYLHAPDGIGRSKFLAKAEQALGAEMTVRNWRTVCKIHELAKNPG